MIDRLEVDRRGIGAEEDILGVLLIAQDLDRTSSRLDRHRKDSYAYSQIL